MQDCCQSVAIRKWHVRMQRAISPTKNHQRRKIWRRIEIPELPTLKRLFWIIVFALSGIVVIVPGARSNSPSARAKVRVMTYNIHVGVGMDKRMDLQRIADVIKQEHSDLVGLQEVDRGVKR